MAFPEANVFVSRPPALLHSLHEFSPLILACLTAVAPRRIVEIGSEAGAFTEDLCAWGAEHEASVVAVEPMPTAKHRRLVDEYGLQLVRGKSPEALRGLGEFDVAVIDGDHNYWAVSQELAHVFSGAHAALAIVHDVAWPCARRDQYYDPADIPAEHRQPFSYEGGVVPGDPGQVDGGFRGEGAFAYALREGGPANGVLTAVEDLLAERTELEFMRVPCIFGLGFIFLSEAPWADELRRLVGPLHESDLLSTLEANRIDLYLRLIDPSGPTERPQPAADGLVASLQRQIEQLQVELARLRLERVGESRDPRSA